MTIEDELDRASKRRRDRHFIVKDGKVCGNVSGDWYR